MLTKCNICRVGIPKWVRYADGAGLMWDDGKGGRPHYVYQCNHCGAEMKEPVPFDWEREHPTVNRVLGPRKDSSYLDDYVFSSGLFLPKVAA